jgi:hypothetical protein
MQEMKFREFGNAVNSVSVRAGVRWRIWAPIAVTLIYPFMLNAFHALVTDAQGVHVALSPVGYVLAALLLLGVFAVPSMGMLLACRRTATSDHPGLDIRARRLALFTVAAPTLYDSSASTRGCWALQSRINGSGSPAGCSWVVPSRSSVSLWA